MFIKIPFVVLFITAALIEGNPVKPGSRYDKRFASPEPRHFYGANYKIGFNPLGSSHHGGGINIKVKSSKKAKDGLGGIFSSAHNTFGLGAAKIGSALDTALSLDKAAVKLIQENAKSNIKLEASIL